MSALTFPVDILVESPFGINNIPFGIYSTKVKVSCLFLSLGIWQTSYFFRSCLKSDSTSGHGSRKMDYWPWCFASVWHLQGRRVWKVASKGILTG
jgi:hypothetical protein